MGPCGVAMHLQGTSHLMYGGLHMQRCGHELDMCYFSADLQQYIPKRVPGILTVVISKIQS